MGLAAVVATARDTEAETASTKTVSARGGRLQTVEVRVATAMATWVAPGELVEEVAQALASLDAVAAVVTARDMEAETASARTESANRAARWRVAEDGVLAGQ